jgi:hypothetical protein
MIKCRLCQTTHVANTIFCDECGTCLLDEENRETGPLDVGAIGWIGGPAHPNLISAIQQNTPLLMLQLKIGSSQHLS